MEVCLKFNMANSWTAFFIHLTAFGKTSFQPSNFEHSVLLKMTNEHILLLSILPENQWKQQEDAQAEETYSQA